MMNKLGGKYLWILIGLVVVVAIYLGSGEKAGQNTVINTKSPSPSSSPSKSTSVKPSVKGSPAPTPSQSYTELVKQYEGKRIQFDERCQAVPNSLTFKNGDLIMLDNRSASAKTVSIGGTKYDLVAYGYRIVTLSSPNLPKELAVGCGSSGNTGKILLQAQILQ